MWAALGPPYSSVLTAHPVVAVVLLLCKAGFWLMEPDGVVELRMFI